MSAREEVLARVRRALGPSASEIAVPRAYRRAGDVQLSPDALVGQLEERLLDYRAEVTRCAEADLAATLGEVLARHRISRLVVPGGVPDSWLASADGVEHVLDDPLLSSSELDETDGVLTGCTVAISETGTIVLDAGPGQGRRALTLVPDVHVMVVRVDQIVASVPDAVARLDPTRPQTWISGPSATSDIELNRVEGVHGPRTLAVVLLSPSSES